MNGLHKHKKEIKSSSMLSSKPFVYSPLLVQVKPITSDDIGNNLNIVLLHVWKDRKNINRKSDIELWYLIRLEGKILQSYDKIMIASQTEKKRSQTNIRYPKGQSALTKTWNF